MTIDELCNKYDCTEEEREQVKAYFLFLRFRAFLGLVGINLRSAE